METPVLSIYALSYLIIISMFKNQFFVILCIFSEMYWTNMFENLIKIFSAKIYILPLNIYSFLSFNFVIWQVAYDYVYSLKHIPFTYFIL